MILACLNIAKHNQNSLVPSSVLSLFSYTIKIQLLFSSLFSESFEPSLKVTAVHESLGIHRLQDPVKQFWVPQSGLAPYIQWWSCLYLGGTEFWSYYTSENPKAQNLFCDSVKTEVPKVEIEA